MPLKTALKYGTEPWEDSICANTVSIALLKFFLCVLGHLLQAIPETPGLRTFHLAVGARSAHGQGQPQVWRVSTSENPQPMSNEELKDKYYCSFSHRLGWMRWVLKVSGVPLRGWALDILSNNWLRAHFFCRPSFSWFTPPLFQYFQRWYKYFAPKHIAYT